MSVAASHLVASVAALEQAERRQVQERKRESDRAREARGRRDEADALVAVESPEAIERINRDDQGQHPTTERRGDRAAEPKPTVYTARGAKQPGAGAQLDVSI
ncbi:MAG: hypothetical protein AAF138_11440 [Planctomycetota bacterium]